MAKEKTDYTAESNMVMRRWQKYKDDAEQNFEAAQKGLHTFFEKALQNDNVRQKIKQDLEDVRRSNRKLNIDNESGYNLSKDDYDPIVDGGDYSASWNEDESK